MITTNRLPCSGLAASPPRALPVRVTTVVMWRHPSTGRRRRRRPSGRSGGEGGLSCGGDWERRGEKRGGRARPAEPARSRRSRPAPCRCIQAGACQPAPAWHCPSRSESGRAAARRGRCPTSTALCLAASLSEPGVGVSSNGSNWHTFMEEDLALLITANIHNHQACQLVGMPVSGPRASNGQKQYFPSCESDLS